MTRQLWLLAIVVSVALTLPAQAAPLSQSIAQKRLADATAAQKPAKPGDKDTTGQSQQSRPRTGHGLRTPPVPAP